MACYALEMAETSAMELQGTCAAGDFIKFQYFHNFRRAWPLLAAAAAFCLLGPGLLLFGGDGPLAANVLPLSGMCLVWLLIMLVAPRWAARRQWKTQWALREPVTLCFDAGGVRAIWSDSSSSAAWKSVRAVRETRSLFLLYYAPGMAHIVPKRFFRDAAEMAAFRALVASAIAPGKIAPPGLVGRWC
jgi:YcxB-like protein